MTVLEITFSPEFLIEIERYLRLKYAHRKCKENQD